MRQRLDKLLKDISVALLTEISPSLKNEYASSNVNLMGYMLLNIANEYDCAAEIRVDENNKMRRIFSDSIRLVDDEDLKERLLTAANSEDQSLKISSLDEANNQLKALLIELQAYLEKKNSVECIEQANKIWEFLEDSASRLREVFPGIHPVQ